MNSSEIDLENVKLFITNDYFISLFLGSLIIFVYCRSRLDDYVVSDDYRFLASLNISKLHEIVDASSFRRVLFWYFCFILAVYLVLCFYQPLAGWVASEVEGTRIDSLWATPAGPFAVAAFIISLGPTVPGLSFIETQFRRLSYKIAGIPDDLIESISIVKSHDFGNPTVNKFFSQERMGMTCRSMKNMERSGVEELDRKNFETDFFSICYLMRWVASSNSDNYWKAETYMSQHVRTSRIAREWRAIVLQIEVLNRECDSVYKNFDEGNGDHLDFTAARDLYYEKWASLARDLDVLSDETRTVFVLLAVKDRRPNYNKYKEPELDRVLAEVWKPKIYPTINVILLASMLASIAVFLGVFLWKAARIFSRDGDLGEIRAGVDLGLANAVGIGAVLVAPIFVGVLIRFGEKSDRKWVPFLWANHTGSFPVFNIVKLVVVSSIVGLMLSVAWYFCVQLVSETINPSGKPIEAAEKTIKYIVNLDGLYRQISIAVGGGLMAATTCHILDKSRFDVLGKVAGARISVVSSIVIVFYVSIFTIAFSQESYFSIPPSNDPGAAAENQRLYRWYDLFVQDLIAYGIFTLAFTSALVMLLMRRSSANAAIDSSLKESTLAAHLLRWGVRTK